LFILFALLLGGDHSCSIFYFIVIMQAIRLIPMEQKQAYLEAVEKAPQLVATETDPLQFVRVSDFDIWAAAQRLCVYWKERKEIFQERAFLPLTLTGNGALTKDDILTLHAGYPALLPRTKSGQQVVFADRRQWVSTANATNRLRCVFYMAKIVAEDERAQTEGILLFIVVVLPRLPDFHHSFVKKMVSLIESALPIRVHLHCLCYLPKTSVKLFMAQEVINRFWSYILEGGLQFLDVVAHVERQEGEVLRDLLGMGLTREGVPTSAGGSRHFVEDMNWCRARALEESGQERKVILKINKRKASNRRTPSPRTATAAASLNHSSQPKQDSQQQILKRRAANAVCSRRKRERRRHEAESLQKERDQCTKDNELLKAEHTLLQGLLDQARAIVSSLSGTSDVGAVQEPAAQSNQAMAIRMQQLEQQQQHFVLMEQTAKWSHARTVAEAGGNQQQGHVMQLNEHSTGNVPMARMQQSQFPPYAGQSFAPFLTSDFHETGWGHAEASAMQFGEPSIGSAQIARMQQQQFSQVEQPFQGGDHEQARAVQFDEQTIGNFHDARQLQQQNQFPHFEQPAVSLPTSVNEMGGNHGHQASASHCNGPIISNHIPQMMRIEQNQLTLGQQQEPESWAHTTFNEPGSSSVQAAAMHPNQARINNVQGLLHEQQNQFLGIERPVAAPSHYYPAINDEVGANHLHGTVVQFDEAGIGSVPSMVQPPQQPNQFLNVEQPVAWTQQQPNQITYVEQQRSSEFSGEPFAVGDASAQERQQLLSFLLATSRPP
jgi:hypothetical protein